MRKRIIIGHPFVGFGGSEGAMVWCIQALVEDYDVTLLSTNRKIDWGILNDFYGTKIDPSMITYRNVPMVKTIRNTYLSALRGSIFGYNCRKVGKKYDLCITAYNITDWGVPAIHLIADFSWDEDLRKKNFQPLKKGTPYIHSDNIIRSAYLLFIKLIFNNRIGDILCEDRDMVIVNSNWSGDVINSKFNCGDLKVLYPPVNDIINTIEWKKREFGFVSIGRIAPEKKVEKQIEIIKRVREKGYNLHFHLVGEINDDSYGKMIRHLCNQNSDWIIPEGRKVGRDKEKVITRHKFAIHGCPHEGFGIGVAELVKGGSIPFVPDSGGQAEIVAMEELIYKGTEEAARKIEKVLITDSLQKTLLAKLDKRKNLFSTKKYMKGVKILVENWFQ